MYSKNLVLLIVAHLPYMRHVEDEQKYAFENDVLFDSISNVYLPLLNNLNSASANFADKKLKVSLVFSPTLCEMLSDPAVQEQYVNWLERRILLGEKEIVRCKDDAALLKNATETLAKVKKDKDDFENVYARNIVKAVSELAEAGKVELLATCGTFAYLPHYSDIPEVLNAQIESGLYSHRKFFGALPDGFYLPYLGYSSGIEKTLRSFGLNYSIADGRAFFFSKDVVENGIFAPVKCEKFNQLFFFAADSESTNEIKSFATDGIFKDVQKDIAFDIPVSNLSDFLFEDSARIPTGFRYYSKNSSVYDSDSAKKLAEKCAVEFAETKIRKLVDAEKLLDKNVSLVCTIPAEMLGGRWAEGSDFFAKLLSECAENDSSVSLVGCSDVMRNMKRDKIEPQVVSLYPSSDSADGFSDDALDNSNAWMIRYARKMSNRMVDIADRFPNDTGLKIRLLNLGAKELLLAQSGEWADLVHDGDDDDSVSSLSDYAAERFKESIKSFIIVYDSLGSNTVSTEWLTGLERKHQLFPWMNFRIFSKKK
ncbi:MAG: DUF1957 domain-containing protein [Treponema sp.]|nr:DUF1957 domain-containing protein [Treponema sp.]